VGHAHQQGFSEMPVIMARSIMVGMTMEVTLFPMLMQMDVGSTHH
jgi:hypothetical protein